jgi:ubiquinone/menaquinone biosynthesis C-methylase UbiE
VRPTRSGGHHCRTPGRIPGRLPSPVCYVRLCGVINLAWDRTSYYQPRLLRALPAQCERVLDVGCGKGEFAIRLAERAGRVDASQVA